MKKLKNLSYLFILMMVFMPLSVLGATSATFSLTCDESVKKDASINCTLNASNISGGTLTAVTGTVATNDFLENGENINVTGLNLTSSGKIKDFTVLTKNTAGKGTITISGLSGIATETTPATTGTCAGGDVPTDETACTTAGGSWNENACSGNTKAYCDEIEGTYTAGADVVNDAVVVTPAVTTLSKDVQILDSVATISKITIDGTENTSCQKGSNGRDCQIPKNASSVTIDVTAGNNGTATAIGKKTLKCGSNTFSTEVKAQDGIAKFTYTFTISRTCNDDVTLKEIKVSSGTLNPTFSATTKEYKVEVTSEINKITITGTKNNSTQTITGNVTDRVLKYGDNVFEIGVKSEKGTTSTYKVTVTRKDTREIDNTLKSLELSAGKLIFNKETTEYKVAVLNEVQTIAVTAVAESTKATIEIVNNNLKLIDGLNSAILVKVKSENELEKTYKILVTRLKPGETLGDNPNLASISVSNYNLGFTPTKDTYTLKIEKEKSLKIAATAEDPTTNFIITGNENLKNGSIIKITSTSADGTTKTYIINIEKSNIMMFIIIGGVVVLTAIGAIVFLIIKNRKDKDFIETDKVKSKIKEEDLMAKVQSQLNTIEPIQQPMEPAPQSYNEVPMQTPIQTPVQPVQPVAPVQTVETPVAQPMSEETKVCSICGHRVSASLATCPYCKRSF